jgi:hypothetical protein
MSADNQLFVRPYKKVGGWEVVEVNLSSFANRQLHKCENMKSALVWAEDYMESHDVEYGMRVTFYPKDRKPDELRRGQFIINALIDAGHLQWDGEAYKVVGTDPFYIEDNKWEDIMMSYHKKGDPNGKKES